MRINLHENMFGKWPRWFDRMIGEYIEEFRKEYSVSEKDVYRYFFLS